MNFQLFTAIIAAITISTTALPVRITPESPRDNTMAQQPQLPRSSYLRQNLLPTYRLPPAWPNPRYFPDWKFKDCRDFENWIDANANAPVPVPFGAIETGAFTLDPNLKARVDPVPGICNGRPCIRSYRADTTVNYTIFPPVKRLTLIRVSWPNMTKAERGRLQYLMDSIVNHEIGHVNLAEAAAREFSGKEQISIIGWTEKHALDNLRETVLERCTSECEKMTDVIKGLQEDYDKITKHGQNQSKIGNWKPFNGPTNIPTGPDLRFRCP